MRRLVFFIVAVIAGTAGSARAESWVKYGSTELFTASIDVDTLSLSREGVTYWTKWDVSAKGRGEMFSSNPRLAKRGAAIKTKWTSTCVGSMRLIELATYVFDGKGVLLESGVHRTPIEYDLVPGTLMEGMHQSACVAALAKMQASAEASVSPAVKAISGYGTLKFGMTLDQVRQERADAPYACPIEKGRYRVCFFRAGTRVEDVPVVQKTTFLDGKLISVGLQFEFPDGLTAEDRVRKFRAVLGQLKKKYGDPQAQDTPEAEASQIASGATVWMVGWGLVGDVSRLGITLLGVDGKVNMIVTYSDPAKVAESFQAEEDADKANSEL